MSRGHVLAYQQILEKVQKGQITGVPLTSESEIKEHVKSSSLDLQLGEEAWRVDRNTALSLRHRPTTDIWQVIKELGNSARRVDLTADDSEKRAMHPGFSYLAPAVQKVSIENDEYIPESPKSSTGRVFFDTRIAFPGYPRVGLMHNNHKHGELVRPWHIVEPKYHITSPYAGLQISQLRFIKGHDARLQTSELTDLLTRLSDEGKPMFYGVDHEGNRYPLNLQITEDGIALKVNLQSRNGYEHLSELPIAPGHGYILETEALFDVPKDYCVLMKQYGHTDMRMITNFAGFIDPNFKGSIVGELESFENGRRFMNENDLIGTFEVLRLNEPTQYPYGEDGNVPSNYYKQVGGKFAKYFASDIEPGAVIGWVTKPSDRPIDLKTRDNPIREYFVPITGRFDDRYLAN